MKRLISGRGVKIGCAFAVATVLGAWAPRASAHGGFPRAFEIIVEPGNPKDVILRSDLWGFFRTTDGGSTWQWACAEVYGSNSLAVNHNNILILPGGRTLVTSAFKGLRITDDLCNWKGTPDLDDQLVEDVVSSNGGLLLLTSTYKAGPDGGPGGIDGTLWQSTDKGDHFTRTGGALPSTFAGSALKLSVSDPSRVYVAGRTLELSGGVLERSDDGGATWKAFLFPLSDDLMTARIAAVHPTRPDVLFIWGDLPEGFGVDAPDEIWGTANGGQTWTKVYKGAGDLPGFAFSPDGTEMLIAGPKDGVQRAKVDDVIAKGQSAFTQEFARQVWGLHWTETGLLAGNDNYTALGIPAFTYGESKDDGETFEGLMSICDVKHDACGATTSLMSACNNVFEQAKDGFLAGRCDVVAADAGAKIPRTTSKPTSTKGGCALAVPTPDSTRTNLGFIALGFIGLSLLRPRSARRKAETISQG